MQYRRSLGSTTANSLLWCCHRLSSAPRPSGRPSAAPGPGGVLSHSGQVLSSNRTGPPRSPPFSGQTCQPSPGPPSQLLACRRDSSSSARIVRRPSISRSGISSQGDVGQCLNILLDNYNCTNNREPIGVFSFTTTILSISSDFHSALRHLAL